MGWRGANDTVDSFPAARSQNHDLRGQNALVQTTHRYKPQHAGTFHMTHRQTHFIHVGSQHQRGRFYMGGLWRGFAMPHGEQIPQCIGPDLIHQRRHEFPD
jgi:hypothetical protein